MKKISLIFTLCSLMNLFCNAQTIKTYTGEYSDKYISGNATYGYFENENFERVYNGNFKFTEGMQGKNILKSSIFREIQGDFVNNMKNGLWIYKSKYEEETGSFNMGIPTGEWIRKEYNTDSAKMILTEKATYINGKKSGNFYYKGEVGCNSGSITTAEIRGFINDEGYFDGIWNARWRNVEEIRKYKNGIIYFRLIRDIQTGKVGYKVDSSNFVNKIFNNLDKMTMRSTVNNIEYKIEDSNEQEFNNDLIFKYQRFMDFGYYIEYDHILCACNNWKGKFYGFMKGEKDITVFYKRKISISGSNKRQE